MHKKITFFGILFFNSLVFAQVQPDLQPSSTAVIPEWVSGNKAPGDSCGTYFNNYVGLQKTTGVLTEYMRLGDNVSSGFYNGRAQKFSVSQPVEVSGVEFYAYHESMTQDSIMVITSLHTYNSITDEPGPEITRDTTYVTHTTFTAILPNISVKSFFDTPIAMTGDYIIAMHSTENEPLIIITNNWAINEGAGEANSFALYENPFYPSFHGWYNNLNDFTYDYDYLMNPLVKYDLHNSFTILNDTICPGAVSAGCVTYNQVGNFTNHQYNAQSSSATTHIVWLWGDGFQNVDITMGCHTYSNAGTYNINLKDTLFRHDFPSPYCIVDVTQPIVVLGPPTAGFSYIQNGLTVDFTNTSVNSDSVWWDFGDASSGTDLNNPSHAYSSVANFTVWMYAYNQCFVDSVMQIITTDDVGIKENEKELFIYPNPANSNFVVGGLSGETKIELINILGEKITSIKTSNSQETIQVSHLPTGTYFVRISSSQGQTTKKISVKH